MLGVARVTREQLEIGLKRCATHAERLEKFLFEDLREPLSSYNLDATSNGCKSPECVGALGARLGRQALLGKRCGDTGLVTGSDRRTRGETPHSTTGKARRMGEALGDCRRPILGPALPHL